MRIFDKTNSITKYDREQFKKLHDDKQFLELQIKLEPYTKSNYTNYNDKKHALILRASAYLQTENYKMAYRHSFRASRINSDDFITNFILGLSLCRLGKPAKAINYLEKAFNIDPTDRNLRDGYFQALFELGKYDQIREIYTTRLFRQPPDVYKAQSIEKWSEPKSDRFQKVLSIEVIDYIEPTKIGDPAEPKTIALMGNEPYWAELLDVRIMGSCSFILTNDNFLLSDDAANPKYRDVLSYQGQRPVVAHKNDLFLIDVNGYEVAEIENGIWLSGYASDAFGHWLPDFLTRLQFLKENPNFKDIPIIVDAGMPKAHIELLHLIADNKLIEIEDTYIFKVKTLVVAPSPYFYPVLLKTNKLSKWEYNALSPRGLTFVKECVKSSVQIVSQQKRRLFISRKLSQYRKLLNEHEIAKEIERFGFEMVFPEEMSIEEQFRLFHSAEWIVAPHGSALINLIYCALDVKILILQQGNMFNTGNYLGPMQSLGYQPKFLASKAVYSEYKHDDFWIDPNDVIEAMRLMGLES